MNHAKTVYNLNVFRILFCWGLAVSYLTIFQRLFLGFITIYQSTWTQLKFPLSPQVYNFFLYPIGPFRMINIWNFVIALLLIIGGFGGKGGRIALWLAFLLFVLLEIVIAPNARMNISNVLFFTMLILIFTPEAFLLSLNDLRLKEDFSKRFKNPTKAVKNYAAITWILPLAYFNSFLTKMINSWPNWLEGETFIGYLLFIYIQAERPVVEFLLRNETLCHAFSFLALLFQAGFIFALRVRTLLPIFVFFGIAFHVVVLLVFNLNFLGSWGLLFFIYLDYHRALTRLRLI